ncbi:MAG: carboxymuconolactone decarboxylase family protein [Candidatus Bathyarchaeota archaeon]|nr:MAG: carboxymuconolactone decarboxylase family protein [Candidatus Bathyarchaeota archaeon]
MREKSPWEIFMEECPGVANAFIELSKEVNIGRALDEKTRNLILVGIFSSTRDPVALRHFVSEAFKAGATKQEIEAAALLPFSVGVSSAEMSIPIIVEAVKSKP